MSLVSRAQVGDTAALGLPFCQAWLPGAEGWLPALDGAGLSGQPQPLQAWLPASLALLCGHLSMKACIGSHLIIFPVRTLKLRAIGWLLQGHPDI